MCYDFRFIIIWFPFMFVLNFFKARSAGSFVTSPFKSKVLPCEAQNKPEVLAVNELS